MLCTARSCLKVGRGGGVGARSLLVDVVVANLAADGRERVLGIVAVEQRGGLFERQALGLDNEQGDERQLECKPTAVDDLVRLVRNGRTAYENDDLRSTSMRFSRERWG